MKNYFLIALLAIITSYNLMAQNQDQPVILKQEQDDMEELKVMYINKDVSTHFIALEEISYVDISNNKIVGDIPIGNVLRLKPIEEGANGIVTIVTESYFVQYMLVYTDELDKVYTRHNIQYSELRSLMDPEKVLTKADMYDYAGKMFVQKKRYYDVSTVSKRLKVTLNNIYTVDKYFFIDLSLKNRSNIQFDIDQIRFKVEDKRMTKATNLQSVEIKPIITYLDDNSFKKNYRNIFVFEKFTFPEDKVFSIEISEKQISGRTILLRISYADVLRADNFIIE
ncbi:MAG: conjugative transposon protein TraN [Paludibacteraceae bacterium]|nr:conjugative transposon protein TraN [Paludibacteraceae bacterium]